MTSTLAVPAVAAMSLQRKATATTRIKSLVLLLAIMFIESLESVLVLRAKKVVEVGAFQQVTVNGTIVFNQKS